MPSKCNVISVTLRGRKFSLRSYFLLLFFFTWLSMSLDILFSSISHYIVVQLLFKKKCIPSSQNYI